MPVKIRTVVRSHKYPTDPCISGHHGTWYIFTCHEQISGGNYEYTNTSRRHAQDTPPCPTIVPSLFRPNLYRAEISNTKLTIPIKMNTSRKAGNSRSLALHYSTNYQTHHSTRATMAPLIWHSPRTLTNSLFGSPLTPSSCSALSPAPVS